jgi:hypothetical protein
VWEQAGEAGATALQSFWLSSANYSAQAAMRGQVLEGVTIMDLGSRSTEYDDRCLLRWFGAKPKSFNDQQRRQVESAIQRITIKPGRTMQFTFDNTSYAQQLQSSWQQPGAWSGRTLLTPVGPTFPEVDCIMLPARNKDGSVEQVELYQITVNNEKDIDRQTLANILCALPDAKRYILYFVVPKEQFRTFTVKNISRGSVSKPEHQARLDRVQARVIANVLGMNALHSYISGSTSTSRDSSSWGIEAEDVISGVEAEGVVSGGSDEDASWLGSTDSATTEELRQQSG